MNPQGLGVAAYLFYIKSLSITGGDGEGHWNWGAASVAVGRHRYPSDARIREAVAKSVIA